MDQGITSLPREFLPYLKLLRQGPSPSELSPTPLEEEPEASFSVDVTSSWQCQAGEGC